MQNGFDTRIMGVLTCMLWSGVKSLGWAFQILLSQSNFGWQRLNTRAHGHTPAGPQVCSYDSARSRWGRAWVQAAGVQFHPHPLVAVGLWEVIE